jgi:hypothetical protein
MKQFFRLRCHGRLGLVTVFTCRGPKFAGIPGLSGKKSENGSPCAGKVPCTGCRGSFLESADVKYCITAVLTTLVSLTLCGGLEAADPIRVLIVDGQNNHGVWPTTTKMMKSWLEQSEHFKVDVATAAPSGTDPNFHPKFSSYQVVISNFGYGAAPWPKETQTDFENFVRGGGGFVVVHAADNSFPEWPA